MPVTRHPPCRPGRAVFPHPVPRSYSLPRCKAEPSSNHSPTFDFSNPGTSYLYPVENLVEQLPGKALPLAASSIEPLEGACYGPVEKAFQRMSIASPTIVIIVSPSPSIHTPEKFTPRQMPVALDPFLDPLAGCLELRTRRAPHDARYALTILPPDKLEAQKREAPLPPGMKTAEPKQVGLVRCSLKIEFLQPFGQYSIQPFGIVPIAEGADPIVCIPAKQRLASTMGFDHFREPQVQDVV